MAKLDEKIKYRLTKINVNYAELKPTVKKHLAKIEALITDMEENKNNLENSLRDLTKTKPNLLSVSNGTKIARQTLYNNNVLKSYIEVASNDIFPHDPNEKYIEKLNKKIAELNEKVEKLQIRDIETEILFLENQKLKELLTNSEANTNLLRSQKEEAKRRLKELEKTSSTKDSKKVENEVISVDFNR